MATQDSNALSSTTPPPRWPTLSRAFERMDEMDVLKRALRMGLSAMGELSRLKEEYQFQKLAYPDLDSDLMPLGINASDEATEHLFSYAMQIVEHECPSADELRALAKTAKN